MLVKREVLLTPYPQWNYFAIKWLNTGLWLGYFDFPVSHDPCTIYYLLHPEDFVVKKAFTQI